MIADRTADTFQFHQEIQQRPGGIDTVLAWCRNECRSDWRWQLLDSSSDRMPGRYVFYFDNDRDACAFALRWS